MNDRELAAVGGCDDVFGRAHMLDTVELVNVYQGTWAGHLRLLDGREVLLDSQLRVPRQELSTPLLHSCSPTFAVFHGAFRCFHGLQWLSSLD